jgi:hypothetical protein
VARGQELSDRFASVLAMKMARLATLLMDNETDPEKHWQPQMESEDEESDKRAFTRRSGRRSDEKQLGRHDRPIGMKQSDHEAERFTPFAPSGNRQTSFHVRSTASMHRPTAWMNYVRDISPRFPRRVQRRSSGGDAFVTTLVR